MAPGRQVEPSAEDLARPVLQGQPFIRAELFTTEGGQLVRHEMIVPPGAAYEEVFPAPVPLHQIRISAFMPPPPAERTPPQEGTCTRCGKPVSRSPGGRWHDQFGRDRCRASFDDDECAVEDP